MAFKQGGPGQLVTLASAATGNFTSDAADRLSTVRPGLLVLDVTAGSTPTVTVNIQASADGVNWFNVPYATTAAPGTTVVTALTLTSTAVTTYHLPTFGWRYLQIVASANTNVTFNSVKVLV